MKICPYCGALNDDKVLYCIKCLKPLPSQITLEHLKKEGMAFYESGNLRRAEESFTKLFSLNPGDSDAGVLSGALQIKLGLIKEGWEMMENTGLAQKGGRCPTCRGSGRCPTCGGEGVCIMCIGTRKCSFCGGTGICPSCGGNNPNCPVCGGTGICPRCHGNGECSYCRGTGRCYTCSGTGICPRCGGTGKEYKIIWDKISLNTQGIVKTLID